jgi:hypothetical protein
MHFKTAKMTAKAKGAIAKVADIYRLDVTDMRKDRAAVREMYNELEGNGYQWVALKQEWAYVGNGGFPFAARTATFVTAVSGMSATDALYVLEESMKAAGYDVVKSALVFDANHSENAFVHVEIKL